jgi:hypothetical protein
MMTKKCFKLGLVLIAIFGAAAKAQDNSIRIPLKTFTKPAVDLLDASKKPLSFAEVTNLFQQGFDLSKLQPIENKYWQNQKYPAVDLKAQTQMPQSETVGQIATVKYVQFIGANREQLLYSMTVQGPSENYILRLGGFIHTHLLRSALLNKLGFHQLSPKYYSKIKVEFKSTDEKQQFIKNAFCGNDNETVTDSCLSVSPFLTDTNRRQFLSDAGESAVYIHGLYLEKQNSEVPSLMAGATPADFNDVPNFSQNRTYRGLLVPNILADFGESLNRVTTQPTFVRDGWAFINYIYNTDYDGISSYDIRWMLNRVLELNDSDWNEIVDAGMYPASLRQLVKAKLLRRVKNMVQTFYDASENVNLKVDLPDLKYTSTDGYVLDGHVTTENIPNYPPRFAQGERQSPFETADLFRYMKIKAQSATLAVAISKLSEYLKLTQTKILESKVTGFEFTDRGFKPLGTVTGIQGGLNFNASRIVTTGTFYGSSAPVQLVDTASVTAGLGVVKIIDELGGFKNSFGSNIGYNREYTHVRPLDSIKETKNIKWADVLVPSKLHHLASPLKDGKLTDFISALKVGEVFTITDSVALMAKVGTDLGLDGLVGLLSSYQPTLGLSAGGGKVIMRQTQISRTDAGFQIFIRDQNSKVFSVQMDANYFINLLRIKAETKNTDLKTDAFILNYNGEFAAQVEKGDIKLDENPELQKKFDQQKKIGSTISAALRSLIFDSNTELLYSNFRKQQFEITHQLKTKEILTKLFWFRATKMEEEHLLKIYKPSVAAPSEASVANAPIEIVTFKKGELKGRDYLGFGLEVVDGILKNKFQSNAPQFSQETQNPSQMPYGQAQWRMVRTDTELTQTRVGALPSVGLVQNVWGGWSLKKKNLDAILNQVQDKLKGTQFEGQKLFADDVFASVKKIDFFRVTSNLSLLPGALDKIKQLIVTPDTKGATVDRAKFLGRLFQKLSELGGKARPEDKIIYNNLMSMIGEGDEARGKLIYQAECEMNERMKNSESSNGPTSAWLNGTNYECLQPWVEKIIKTARHFESAIQSKDLRTQNRLMTELVYVLEEKIPLTVILKTLERQNYLFFVEVTGFRSGDEDGDQGVFVSNILGEPEKKHPYSNGLINVLADKSKILSIELDRSQTSF